MNQCNAKMVIEVARYSPNEMAFVSINGKIVFTGNYLDFHSGCHGTKIAGYNLDGIWSSGIDALAVALSKVILKEGKESDIVHKKLSTAEYNQYFGS